MNSILPIIPFTKKACAEVRVPPSKSITNRALLLAAICGEPTLIKNPLRSRDSEIMLESLKRLGFSVIAQKNGGVEVSGSPRKEASLFVGNAGTAARFLTAYACAIEDGHFEFDSDAEMYARPMSGLIEALKEQGAQFEFLREENAFPFRVKTCGLKGGKIKLDASLSSQILSAVLMAAPLAKSDTQIELEGGTVSKPFVEMTLKMMSDFGFGAERTGGGSFLVRCGKAGVSPKEYEVESDATAASYPIMLAGVAGGAVLIKNYPKNSIQGDAKFAEFAESAGLARLARLGGDLLAIAPDAPAASCGGDFNDISDTFPTIAAASGPLLCKAKISGIAHTKLQETDRISAISSEASKFCKSVCDGDDFIEIEPYPCEGEFVKNVRRPVEISTYKDHRIAMSFAVAGCKNIFADGKPWLHIKNPECCSKTWADFFEVLEKARADSDRFKIVAVDGGAAVGKSSVSRECSKILGYMHVDTGAHYRTLTYILLESGITSESPDADIAAALNSVEISASVSGSSAKMSISGRDISDQQIRTERINQNVSIFAAKPFVREFLKQYQRSMADFARERGFGGLVMEGRDIGSVIFPNADIKIFLDADEETRAARRAKEGIKDSISKRDAIDKNRKTAPLVQAEGAVRIDTSNMTKSEVVTEAVSLIIKA